MRPKLLAPLVGRAPQLDIALDAVASAQDGRGNLILVHGEAGIGKTRLCHAVRSRLDPGRTQVLTGRASLGDANILYSALADSLRGARRSEPRLWAAACRRAETLAAVVPELARKGSVSSTLVDRPVVFEALLDVVEEAATDRATLWFVEDLHWADPATWDFVGYAARRVGDMSLTLAVTFRDEELPDDRWSGLLALDREPEVIVLPLDRLGTTDTQAMIRALAPYPPGLAAPIVESISLRSAGNPLLVEGLLAIAGDASGAVPDIVRAAVRERVSRLDGAGLAVLEAAATLGPRFEVRLLLQITPVDPDRADELMAGGGLLASVDDAEGDVLAFWHPLVWEAVYKDIPLPRRRQLHATIAAMLEGQALQAEIAARHHELAEDPEAALETFLVARKAAGANVGRTASLAHAALDLARRHDALRAREDELVLVAINDLSLAGRWTELEPLVNDLWPRRHGMAPETRAWLANVYVLDRLFLRDVSRARAVADEEVAHVEAAGGAAAGGLLYAQAGFLAYFTGDHATALRHAERAVELARSAGDLQAQTRARLVEILALRRLGGTRDAAVADQRANAETARAAGLTVGEANALFAMAYTSLSLDDFAGVERVAADVGTWYAPMAGVCRALVLVLEGRPDPAEALLARAGPELRGGDPTLRAWVDAAEAHLFLHRGELDHARQVLEAATPMVPMHRSAHAGAVGWLAWEEGSLHEAAAAFDTAQESCLSGGGYNFLDTGPLMLPLHADVLMRLDQRAQVQRIIDSSAGYDATPDRFSLAALAAASFRLAPSEETAAAAEAAAAGAPWPWLHALLGCWRGEFLADEDATASARERFEVIAAPRGVERADGVLRRLGKRAQRRDGPDSGGLSKRELQVAGLVSEGLTNSAIAARLFVSRATVSSHVTHILTKLGYTSRAQIAAWVAARSLR